MALKTPTITSEERAAILALQIPAEKRRRHEDGYLSRAQDKDRACGSKRAYTYEYAREVVERFRRNHNQIMDAYRCRHCQSWHVGHPVDRK